MATLQALLCWMLAAILPATLAVAQEGAILDAKGLVWVNNNPVPGSAAVLPGNTIQTFPGSLTRIVMNGSQIIVQPESIVKFQSKYVELEHGSVRVQTSTGLAVHANCLHVSPGVSDLTVFEVTDVNWSAHIAAIKQGLSVAQFANAGMSLEKIAGLKHMSLAEGQTLDHDDHCKEADQGSPAVRSLPNYKYLLGAGLGTGLLVCLVMHCFGGGNTPLPASPSKPCSANESCD